MIPAMIFGGHGLLGSAIARQLRGQDVAASLVTVRWTSGSAHFDIEEAVRSASPKTWWFWCAGRGVTSSSEREFDDEVLAFERFLSALEQLHDARQCRIFLTSSAGALFAGAGDPPYDDNSSPRPLVAYGRAKLGMEDHLAGFVARTGALGWAARISNLYGPGQDTRKPQGIVTHSVKSALNGEPLRIFMPYKTRRDYLFVDDGARMVIQGMAALTSAHSPMPRPMLSHGETHTISEIIEAVQLATGRTLAVVREKSALAVGQAVDLTITPTYWAGLDGLPRTSLREGVAQVVASLVLQSRLW